MINQRIMVTAIVKKGKKYLLLKRSRYNKMYPDQWQLPEGGIKFGEAPVQALKREMKEETNMVLKGAKLADIESSTIKYFNKRMYHFIRLVYVCRASGKIRLSNRHKEHGWFTKREIRDLDLLKGFNFSDIEKVLK